MILTIERHSPPPPESTESPRPPQEDPENVLEQIVEAMVERMDLWASLYDYEGSRLLEMLPKYDEHLTTSCRASPEAHACHREHRGCRASPLVWDLIRRTDIWAAVADTCTCSPRKPSGLGPHGGSPSRAPRTTLC
eukprot:COSAG01_NODE_40689_length_460_cov_7.501385_1_plen_135_part_01